jgi:hypothetical protein
MESGKEFKGRGDAVGRDLTHGKSVHLAGLGQCTEEADEAQSRKL